MRVICGITHLSPPVKKPVVALGVFDGLHRGHRRIIARLIKEAKKLHTESLLITFFPHPQKEDVLYSLPHRLKLIGELGVDSCLIINFTPVLSKIDAEEFLRKIIINKINPAVVIIGRNFTFGRYARGNWQMLKGYSKIANFKLIVLNVLSYKGKSISSTWIRALIKKGNFSQAQALLGRPVTIFGKVGAGYSFARRIGYPTANISPEHEVLPPFGVYAVKVRLDDSLFAGICYIGNRPTISVIAKGRIKGLPHKTTSRKTNVEVHIFNFDDNLYGRKIQIEFVRMIRPQRKFTSIQALASQIKKDINSCLRVKAV